MTAYRSGTNIYYNTGSKPIMVAIAWGVNGNGGRLFVNGVPVDYFQATGGGNVYGFMKAIVPPGASYYTNFSIWSIYGPWMELR